MSNEKANVGYEKAYAFAIRIVRCCRHLTNEKKKYVLSKQLLQSGTSIGANLAEANGAISKADFSAKGLHCLHGVPGNEVLAGVAQRHRLSR